MSKFYIPSKGVESWRSLLADPDKHWKTGYSAKALAYCWEEAQGFPNSVKNVFKQSPYKIYHNIEFLIGIPEHTVDVPGRGKDSQNDIFIIAKGNDELITIAVEGKVSENFGDKLVEEWISEGGGNRQTRLEGLAEILGLNPRKLSKIRYQLLHRTASAILEARRFTARHALMLVHTFSQSNEHFEDYEALLRQWNKAAKVNEITQIGMYQGVVFYTGWVTGEKKYLKAGASN